MPCEQFDTAFEVSQYSVTLSSIQHFFTSMHCFVDVSIQLEVSRWIVLDLRLLGELNSKD